MTALEIIFTVALVAGLAVEFIIARGLAIQRGEIAHDLLAAIDQTIDAEDHERVLAAREQRLANWEHSLLRLGAEVDALQVTTQNYATALRARAEELGLDTFRTGDMA